VLGGTGGATLDDVLPGVFGGGKPPIVEVVEIAPCEAYAELLEEELEETLERCLEAEVQAHRAAQRAVEDCTIKLRGDP